MTSNVGGNQNHDGFGFCPAGRDGQTEEQLRQTFSPEFLGRLDRIVHFRPLHTEDMECIASRVISLLRHRVSDAGMELELPDVLAQELAAQCKKQGGARQLRQLVQQKIEAPLANFLLTAGTKPKKITAEVENGEILFHF